MAVRDDTSVSAGERAHGAVGSYRIGVLIDFPNRPGYTGPDYLVIRHAKGGRTELVGTSPVE